MSEPKTSVLTEYLATFFDQRKNSFLTSLQHILAAVTSDLFIQQMFEDPASAMYIPDRVCELVRRYLFDDREKIIQDLCYRIQYLEACFGSEKIVKIEELGKKIVYANSNAQTIDPDDLHEQLQTLIDLPPICVLSKQEIFQMKQNLESISKFLLLMKDKFQNITKTIYSNNQIVKEKTNKIFISLIAKQKESEQREQQYKQQLKEITNRFTKVDIPKIRKSYEDEIETHVKNEDNLQKSLNKLKKTLLKITQEHSITLDEMKELKQKLSQSQNNESQFNNAKSMNSKLDGLVSSLQKEITEKNQRIEELLSDNQNLTSEFTLMQTNLCQNKISLNSKINEIQQLKEYIEKIQMEMKNQSDDLKSKDADIQLLNSKVSSIPELLEEKGEMIEKLSEYENQIQKLKEFASKQKQSTDQLQIENALLKNDIDNFKVHVNQIDKLKQINEQYLTEIDNLKTNSKENAEKVAEHQIENNKLKKINNEKDQQINEREEAIKLLRNQIDLINKKNSEMSQNIEMMKVKQSELLADIQSHQKILRQKEMELNEAYENNKELETEYQNIQKQMASINQEKKDAKIILSQTNESLLYTQDEIKKKDKLISNLMKQEQETRKRGDELIQQLDIANQKIKNEKSQNEQSNSKIKSLIEQLQSIKTQNENLITEIKKYDEKLKYATDDKTKLYRSNIELKKEIQQYHNDLQLLQNNSSTLQTKIADLNNELKITKDQIDELQILKQNLLTEKKQLQNQLVEDQKRFNQETSNAKIQVTKAISDKNFAEEQLDKVKSQIKSLSNELKQKEGEYKLENEKNLQNINSIKTENDTLSKYISKLKVKNDQLKEIIKKLHENMLKVCPSFGSFDNIPEIISNLQEETSLQSKLINSIKSILIQNNQDIEIANSESGRNSIMPDQTSNEINQTDDIIKQNNSIKNAAINQNDINDDEMDGNTMIDLIQQIQGENHYFKEKEKLLWAILNEGDGSEEIFSIIKRIKNDNVSMKIIQERLMSILNTNSPQELSTIIQEMKDELENFNEREKILQNLIPNSTFDSIPKEIESYQKSNEIFTQNEKEIKEIMESNDFQTTKTKIVNLKEENKEKIELISKLTEMLNTPENEIIQSLEKLQLVKEQLTNEQSKIREIIHEKSKSLIDSVSIIKNEKESLQNEIDSINQKIPNIEGSASNRVSIVLEELNQLNQYKKLLETVAGDKNIERKIESQRNEISEYEQRIQEIESLLPDSIKGSINEKIKKMITSIDEMTQERNMISSMLTNQFKQPKLIDKITALLKQNQENSNRLDRINCSMPEKLQKNKKMDITNKVDNLVSKFHELNTMITNLHQLFPPSTEGSNLDEKISSIVLALNQLQIEKESILSIIPKEYSNDTVEGKIISILNDLTNQKQTEDRIRKFIPNHENIETGISDLVNQLSELNEEKERIEKVIPDELDVKSIGIEMAISSLIDTIDDLKSQQEQINSIMPSELQRNDLSLCEKVLKLINMYKSLKVQQEAINSLIPDDIKGIKSIIPNEFIQESIEKKISDLVIQYNQLKQKQEQIDSIIPKEFSQYGENQISALVDQYNQLKQQEEQIKQIIPDEFKQNDNIDDQIKNLTEKYKMLKQQQKSIHSIISTESQNESLEDKINGLYENCQQLQQQEKIINSLIPPEFSQNDNLQTKIDKLTKEYQQLKKQQESINSLIPNDSKADKLEDKINNLLKENRQFKKQQEEINSILSSEATSDLDIKQQIKHLTSQNDMINSLIPDEFKQSSEKLEDQVKNLIEQYKSLKQQEKAINSIISPKIRQNDSIEQCISDLSTELDQLKSQHERIQSILSKELNNDDSVENQVNQLITLHQNQKSELEKIDLLIPNEFKSNKTIDTIKQFNELKPEKEKTDLLIPAEILKQNEAIEDNLNSLVESYKQMKSDKETIESFMPTEIEKSDNFVQFIRNFVLKYNNLKSLIPNEISQTGKPLNDCISQLVSKYQKLKSQTEKIQSLTPHELNEMPIDKRVELLTKENKTLKDKHNQYEQIVRTNFLDGSQVDLAQNLNNLSNQYKTLKNQAETIESNLPGEIEGKDLNEKVSKLANQYNELKQTHNTIKSILPIESFDTKSIYPTYELGNKFESENSVLLNEIQDLVNKYNKLKSSEQTIQSLMPTNSNKKELNEQVSELVNEYNMLTKQIEKVKSTIPIDSNQSIGDQLTQLYQKYTKIQSQIENQIGSKSDNLTETVSSILNEYRNQKSVLSKLDSIIPNEFQLEQNLFDKSKKLIDQYKLLLNEQNQIESALPIEFKTNLNLFDNVNELIKQFNQLQLNETNLRKLIPIEFRNNSLNEGFVSVFNKYNQFKQQEIQLKEMIPNEFSNEKDLIRQIDALVKAFQMLKSEKETIVNLFPENYKTNGKLEEQIESIINQQNQIDQFIFSYEKVHPTEKVSLPKKVEQLCKSLKKLEEMNAQLTTSNNKFIQTEKYLDSILPSEFNGDITNKIEEMIRERNVLKPLIIMKATDEASLKDVVNRFLDEHETFDKIIKIMNCQNFMEIPMKLEKLLNTHKIIQNILNSDNIIDAVTSINNQLKLFLRLFDIIEIDDQISIETKIQNLIENIKRNVNLMKKAKEILGCNSNEEIIDHISNLKLGVKSANEIISKIISIISPVSLEQNQSNQSIPSNLPKSLEFPLINSKSEQLIKLFIDFRCTFLDFRSKINEVLMMAKGLGYLGTDLMESVLFIRDTAVGDENQKNLERMTAELTGMRAISERERKAYDERKEKLRKKIEEQRDMISQLQEKMVQKENECNEEIQKHQRNARMVSNEYELQKRIHEELIRMIAGQPIDSEYLKLHLDPKELQLIMKKHDATKTAI